MLRIQVRKRYWNKPAQSEVSGPWPNHGQDEKDRKHATTTFCRKPFDTGFLPVEVTGFEPVAPTLRT
jgi:hypothetical protein